MIVLIISNIILVIGIVLFIITDCIDRKRPIVIKEAKSLREYYVRKLRAAEDRGDEESARATRYEGLYEAELERNRKVDSMERELELERSENTVLQDKVRELTEDNESLEATIEEMAKENQLLKQEKNQSQKQAKKKSGAKKK